MNAQRTRVKICGITRLQDALAAQCEGADALGFVFVSKSKRFITPKAAASIVRELSPFIGVVGLFLNASQDEVEAALTQIPTMLPQFHGEETAQYCEQFNRPYIKALGMSRGMPGAEDLSSYVSSQGFLFDSNAPGALGGTGHVFDWGQLDDNLDKPLILAGGLNAQNVQAAISQVAPHALDVSSGVETSRGIKCADALRAFMRAVAAADSNRHTQISGVA